MNLVVLAFYCRFFALLLCKENGKEIIKENPSTKKIGLKTLNEFSKLVDQHQMNVTVVLSKSKYRKDGTTKQVIAMTLTFPQNGDSLTRTHLNLEVIEPFFHAAGEEKVAVRATTVGNGYFDIVTNDEQGVPINEAYSLVTGFKNLKTILNNQENYINQQIFKTEDGKTTKIIYAGLKVELVAHENFTKNEIKSVQKILVRSFFSYNGSNKCKAIAYELNDTLPPPPGHSWNIAANYVSGADDASYLDAETWAHFKIMNENYLVYLV